MSLGRAVRQNEVVVIVLNDSSVKCVGWAYRASSVVICHSKILASIFSLHFYLLGELPVIEFDYLLGAMRQYLLKAFIF
jgi:hypothetical protein